MVILLRKITGGTKAPPYGVEEGFFELMVLPPGEAVERL